MPRFVRPSYSPVAALTVLTYFSAASAFAQHPFFTSATALNGQNGIYFSAADPVSAAAGAVGYGGGVGGWGAARWAPDGSRFPLGGVPGLAMSESYALGINSHGQAVGHASFVGVGGKHAVRWSADGSATQLGVLTGYEADNNFASGINNAGQSVGWYFRGLYRIAVRWAADGSVSRLSNPPNDNWGSVAVAINDVGQTVGNAILGSGMHAVRWEPNGSVRVLSNPPGTQPGDDSDASCINNAGQAAGQIESILYNYKRRAVRWAGDGSATLLGDVPGYTTRESDADGIDDTGLVVGDAFLVELNDTRGVIWDRSGNAALLQDVMADGNSWTFRSAFGIDSDGLTIHVLARGSKNGGPEGWYFVSAPVPEPIAGALLAFAAAACRRRSPRAPLAA